MNDNVIEFGQPDQHNLVFHQEANHVRLELGNAADPVDLTGGTVRFLYRKADGSDGQLISPANITVQPGVPTASQTRIDFDMPADLAGTSPVEPLPYILIVDMPGQDDPWQLMAGKFWRRAWR